MRDRVRGRFEGWATKLNSGSRAALRWIVGIAGFLVLRDAITQLAM
ncbi:hypothetical protein SAMN05421505_13749 [Sinosporangium album]|uniref:Uncharacterized protein n=1 Tax=Sinosporangium album TaxID=504805 RepID=A0A1G8IJG2_9ACTN|nr:hypothetical protein [Sinosporangium album]SDI18927.1 hypothetical protein SAMN05421505_13749 [Sinosporangium album]